MKDRFDWERYLQDDETLLWAGRPNPRYRLFGHGWDFVAVPFGALSLLVFLAVALEPFLRADDSTNIVVVAQQWAPSILLAFMTGFGHQWVDHRRRKHLHYAVTDRRVLTANAESGQLVNADTVNSALRVVPILGRDHLVRFVAPRHRQSRKSFIWSAVGPMMTTVLAIMFTGHWPRGHEFRLLDNQKQVVDLVRQQRDTNAQAQS